MTPLPCALALALLAAPVVLAQQEQPPTSGSGDTASDGDDAPEESEDAPPETSEPSTGETAPPAGEAAAPAGGTEPAPPIVPEPVSGPTNLDTLPPPEGLPPGAKPEQIDPAQREVGPAVPDYKLQNAQDMAGLTKEQVKWLKPQLNLLPPNPYDNTDFTAYALEWGELKLGLVNTQFGILPRTQVGTIVLGDLVGVWNGNAKVDLIRLGPVDLAFRGDYARFDQGHVDYHAWYADAGAYLSLKFTEKWSLHGGGLYGRVSSDGIPDLGPVLDFFSVDFDAGIADEIRARVGDDFGVDGEFAMVRVATDVRFNRRDSIVLQFSHFPWGRVITEGVPQKDIPDLFGLKDILTQNGPVPVEESYNVSLAWQVRGKHAEGRFGAGVASTPFWWVLSAYDLSWHFFGETRVEERKMRKTWRKNRRATRRGETTEDKSAPPPPDMTTPPTTPPTEPQEDLAPPTSPTPGT